MRETGRHTQTQRGCNDIERKRETHRAALRKRVMTGTDTQIHRAAMTLRDIHTDTYMGLH